MKFPTWLKSTLVGSIIGLVIGYLVFFVLMGGPGYQGFVNRDNVVLDTSRDTSMFPYTTETIDKLDQYELEAVFTNEGDRELKKQKINQLTRRYPLDWVNYPPNSSKFQSEQAKYVESFSTKSSAEELNAPYKDIGDGNLAPPDTSALEREERQILTTYKPQNLQSATTYDVYDANKLLEQVYKPKGLIPQVVRKDGNVFEVVSTRSTKEKIVYEDDLPEASYSENKYNPAAGEGVIEVPATAMDTSAARDPFFEPTNSTRSNRSDYTRWTPGLERMFAPTYEKKDWIGKD